MTSAQHSSRVGYAALIGIAALAGIMAFAATTSSPNADDAPDEIAALTSCPSDAECITAHTETGDYVFTVEWALDTLERTCGLMFREEMDPNHGMVFDFFEERGVSFWMRNTLISLDMVFIEADGTVLNIAEGTTPLSLEGVPSAGPVRYVLELIAGTVDRISLEPGDMLDLERAPGMTEGTAICAVPEG